MGEVIKFILIVGIWGGIAIYDTIWKRNEKAWLNKKIEDSAKKNDTKAAAFYIDRYTHMK